MRNLAILADAAKYDASCASSGTTRRNSRGGGIGSTTGTGICHSYTPDGRCVSLLKILLTNFCIYDCLYCINRVSSNVQRARFTPEEVVQAHARFLPAQLHRRFFPQLRNHSQSRTTQWSKWCVSRARCAVDHQFRGYIHLKTIPEASPELIAEAGKWADRISINVELPTQSDLRQLAPEKNLARIETSMTTIKTRIDRSESGTQKIRKGAAFRARRARAPR